MVGVVSPLDLILFNKIDIELYGCSAFGTTNQASTFFLTIAIEGETQLLGSGSGSVVGSTDGIVQCNFSCKRTIDISIAI